MCIHDCSTITILLPPFIIGISENQKLFSESFTKSTFLPTVPIFHLFRRCVDGLVFLGDEAKSLKVIAKKLPQN